MYKENTIGAVVPAYNEEQFIGSVIDAMPTFVDRIYVIDDDSSDNTWREIQECVDEKAAITQEIPVADGGSPFDRRVVPIQHQENRGVGGAIKTGYLRARSDGIDVTVVMGGDDQMNPNQLDRLIEPVVEQRADYAKGNRLLNRGHCKDMTHWRFFGNAILTFLTKISSGYWKTMDPQNGYTAISHRALSELRLESLYDDYGFTNELLVRLNAREMRIADVAMPAVYGDEQSSIKYTTFLPKLSKLLLQNFLWRLKTKYLIRDFHPLVLFYGIGVGGVSVGLLGGLHSLLSSINPDSRFTRLGVSVLTILVASSMVLLAMLFDMEKNEHLELQEY
jgi:glycosyltransferase involved in cell wall biosynthesis